MPCTSASRSAAPSCSSASAPATARWRGLWRGTVDVAAGPEGIRRQIAAAVPELLAQAGVDASQLRGVGIGFGGPVDDATQTIIKSHQIDGWDNFPLADWIADVVGLPAVLGNDADVAGLAEALHGAGKGLSPIFYITIGSGIGGGLIIDGEIYRGVRPGGGGDRASARSTARGPVRPILEELASGWGIEQHAKYRTAQARRPCRDQRRRPHHGSLIAEAHAGRRHAQSILDDAWTRWPRRSATSSPCSVRAASSSAAASR